MSNIIPFKTPLHLLELTHHAERNYELIHSLISDPDMQEIVTLSTDDLLKLGCVAISVTGQPDEIQELRGVLLSALVWIAARQEVAS